MKPFLKKTLFWILFIVFNAFVIEFTLRLYDYFFPSSIFYRESYNQYRGKPHSDSYGFALNAGGFKDVDFNQEKAAGTYRIIGMGDSFTFGVVPYPYHFLTILEDTLNSWSATRNIEILNMGISSTGPPQYLSLLADEVLPLSPDMILLSLFVGNDIQEGSMQYTRRRKLYSHSHLLSLINYIYIVSTSLTNVRATFGEGAKYCDSCSYMSPEKYLDIETGRSYVFQKDNQTYQKDFDDTLYYLTKIANTCKNKGILLVVVIIPDEVQVNTQLRRQVQDKLAIDLEEWDNTQPNRALKQQFSSLDVPVIDLLDPFVDKSMNHRLYIPRDTHWNIKGNQLAADEIARAFPGIMKKNNQALD